MANATIDQTDIRGLEPHLEAQGKSATQLTRSKGFDGWPRWTPGRDELAFVSDRSGSLDVWTITPGVAQ
jgi:Tol biopolymer transport system component